MVPQEIFNEVRYGSGQEAALEVGSTDYIIRQEFVEPRNGRSYITVEATKYTDTGTQKISPASIPTSEVKDWDVYYLGER